MPPRHVLLVSLLVLAPTAHASGLALRWDACAGEGTGTSVRSFACNTDAGQDRIVGSFVPPVGMTGVQYIELTLKLDTCPFLVGSPCGSTLPAWWQFYQAGTCRQNALAPSFVNDPANAVCQSWSAGEQWGAIASYQIGIFGPNTARLRMVAASVLPDAGDVAAETQYQAFALTISHANTVGSGACGGCNQPLAVIFTIANLVPMNYLDPSLFIGNPLGAPYDAVAWWQSGPVAARVTTWGAVKALYR